MVRKSNRRLSATGRGGTPLDRRGRRALVMRQTILRAAARVFRRRGFAATGMREIADAADLSPGNLYYYFKSKHELLYFCQDHSLDRMLATCRSVQAGRLGAGERLAAVVRSHVACMLDELDGAAAHTEVEALPPRLRGRIVAKRDRYEAAVRRIVTRACVRGLRPVRRHAGDARAAGRGELDGAVVPARGRAAAGGRRRRLRELPGARTALVSPRRDARKARIALTVNGEERDVVFAATRPSSRCCAKTSA